MSFIRAQPLAVLNIWVEPLCARKPPGLASPLVSASINPMPERPSAQSQPVATSESVAILWDESLLWGIMLFRALTSLGIPFSLLRAAEVESRLLGPKRPKVLMVPGGFASRKARALGPKGIQAVRAFVRQGGLYVGFCGGAGLALSSQAEPRGLGLCSWKRKPMRDRLPNFSGHIGLSLTSEKAISLQASPTTIQAPAWWPSQFQPSQGQNVRVLARYGQPGSDFWVADLPAEDMTREDLIWWEQVYGINLNPELIADDPCVIQGSFGQGRFLLSYVHLESPNSWQANQWLVQLLASYLEETLQNWKVPEWRLHQVYPVWHDSVLESIRSLLDEVIAQGQSHFLLCWRSPWLLGWKRGIPGFALNTLLAMVSQIMELPPSERSVSLLRQRAAAIRSLFEQFQDCMSTYLAEERKLSLCRKGAPASNGSDELQSLRKDLVGPFPGQGGLYGQLAKELDQLLWAQLQRNLWLR